jgi:hypothetical protein
VQRPVTERRFRGAVLGARGSPVHPGPPWPSSPCANATARERVTRSATKATRNAELQRHNRCTRRYPL